MLKVICAFLSFQAVSLVFLTSMGGTLRQGLLALTVGLRVPVLEKGPPIHESHFRHDFTTVRRTGNPRGGPSKVTRGGNM
jgi:hypothetical protein